jgi:HemY protein
MLGILWFMIKVAVAIAAVIWLVNQPGIVSIPWQGQVIEMPFGVFAGGVLALMALSAVLYRVYRGVARGPRAIDRSLDRSRQARGYGTLSQGLVAVAAGDAEAARKLARKADGLLKDPPLTMLLQAQAAQLNGDEQAARVFFEKMLEREETEFLGLRGLLMQALREDDLLRALALAGRARAIQPKTPWLVRTAFNLEVRLRRWSDALETLSAGVRAKVFGDGEARHYKAAVLVEQSREKETEGQMEEAMRLAHQAVRLEPDFVPAVVREARLLARTGRDSKAVKAIEKAWAKAPHPLLAEAAQDIAPANEEPLARAKRFERLFRQRPDHRESHIALGEAALSGELWGQAREHLLKAETDQPSRRVYRLLAELEIREKGDPEAARGWLIKGEEAPADPAWVCRSCGTLANVWSVICPNCDAVDSMVWESPKVAVHLPAPERQRPKEIDAVPVGAA